MDRPLQSVGEGELPVEFGHDAHLLREGRNGNEPFSERLLAEMMNAYAPRPRCEPTRASLVPEKVLVVIAFQAGLQPHSDQRVLETTAALNFVAILSRLADFTWAAGSLGQK